jgi:hypothetical protein
MRGQEPCRDEIEIIILDDRRMKRMSAVLVAAGLLSIAIPGGAVHAAREAGSLDSVVRAIKKQFVKKSSVRFSVKRRGGPPPAEDIQASGAYRFRASGVYAADEVHPAGGRSRRDHDDEHHLSRMGNPRQDHGPAQAPHRRRMVIDDLVSRPRAV